MIFLVAAVIVLLTTSAHCQLQTTYLDADTSFVSLQQWNMEPEGAVSFRIRTFQLNASLLYMQGDADNFIYVELFNGQVRMTLNDGNTSIMATLPRPFNTNNFRGMRLVRTAGLVNLTDTDFSHNLSVNFNERFNVVAPIYVAGIDDPTNALYDEASAQPHFVGCIDNFQIGNSTTATIDFDDNNVVDNSSDVIFGACSGRCINTECNGGVCIEYYTRAECNCGVVDEGHGKNCTGNDRAILFDGTHYTCFTLPQYDSPYSENETIRIFLQDPSVIATLMTGRQGNYKFNLYFDRSIVHYELQRGDVTLVSVKSDSILNMGGQLVISRTQSEIRMVYNGTLRGMAAITAEELATLRFTDICVGGGIFSYPILSEPARNVYYNFYALFDDGTEYRERNVSAVTRVNFIDSSASVTLPGNLSPMSALHIRMKFRTSQQNAILLHSEDSDNYFRLAINNSQVLATISFEGTVITVVCDGVSIAMYEWYDMIVEPVLVVSIDGSSEIGVNLIQLTSGSSSTCPIQNSILNRFRSVPLVLGGSASGIDGFMGCLELTYNQRVASFDTVLSDVIGTENCEPCAISPSPCMNGGTCMNLNDCEFNCSCVDSFFGRFCELMTSSTPVMTSSIVQTTTVVIPTTSASPSPSPSSSTPSPIPSSTTSMQITSTPPTTSSVPMNTSTSTPEVDDEGSDDSNLGAIIGIVLAIVVGLLLLLLVVLIIIVVIRNRNNRQGFYHTYEGKGGDEMILKYSASLRSVTKPDTSTENGGTINRAGSVKKEQEYYI